MEVLALKKLIFAFLVLTEMSISHGEHPKFANKNVGEPLFLTPYLKAGKIQEAQRLSKLTDPVHNTNLTKVVSYSGYFTVNETYGSNMFFWFFPAQLNRENAPVVLWLQGGPGVSSLFGLFVEIGPFIVDGKRVREFRQTSWSTTHSMLYLDSPVGTGFSFTKNALGYATKESDVADGLYNAISQFFTLFPDYQSKGFYITGESYAGKYVPAISVRIHEENQNGPKIKINLKGVAIGDAWTDPISLINYGEYLYNVGILDENQLVVIMDKQEQAKYFIKNKQYVEASEIIEEILGFRPSSEPFILLNMTGLNFPYNFLYQSEPPQHTFYEYFVQQDHIRKALHVGNLPFNNETVVRKFMLGDIMKSAAYLVTKLLDAPEKYKVFLYNGQLDYCVTVTGTEKYLQDLKWHGTNNWKNATRQIWRNGKDVAGFVKVVDNLTFLVVRNAGHMVPYDQPEWSYDMINRFTTGKPFA